MVVVVEKKKVFVHDMCVMFPANATHAAQCKDRKV